MISVIIPFYNEEKNIRVLHDRLTRIMEKGKFDYEIVFVDDGSSDQGLREAESIAGRRVKVISHRKRFGKGKALSTGVTASRGDIIVFMDADLQDNPEDIPNFIGELDRGYDLVNGWRISRKDGFVKTVPSKIGNLLLLKLVFQSKYHDINCGYKAMRREVLDEIPLYGDNFRFLPIIAEKNGFRTTEIQVAHNRRLYGVSKYGFFRRFTIFADIISTYFIYRFSEKPLHFFGPIGTAIFLTGSVMTCILVIERIVLRQLLYRRPALLLGIFMIMVGLQIVMTGIIAELIVYLQKKKS